MGMAVGNPTPQPVPLAQANPVIQAMAPNGGKGGGIVPQQAAPQASAQQQMPQPQPGATGGKGGGLPMILQALLANRNGQG